MVAEERNSSWLIIIAVLLALVIGFWLWIRQDEKRDERSLDSAEKAMDNAEKVVLKAGESTFFEKEPEPIPEAKAESAKVAEAPAAKAAGVEETKAEEAVPASKKVEKEPEPAPAKKEETPEPAPAKEPEAPAAKATDAGEADDLTKVEGIGPKYRDVLVAAGITTYEKLSKLNVEEIEEIIKAGGARKSASIKTWAEQATLAAAGKWDELQTLQDQLSGGRR